MKTLILTHAQGSTDLNAHGLGHTSFQYQENIEGKPHDAGKGEVLIMKLSIAL